MIDRTKLASRIAAARASGAVRVELWHRATAQLRTVRVSGAAVFSSRSLDDATQVAEDCAEAAEVDSLGEGAAYEVRMLDQDGAPVVVYPFTVGRVKASPAVPGPSIEAPTEQGLLGMLMRHQEATMRLAATGQAELLASYQRLLEERDRRISELEERELSVRQQLGALAENQASIEVAQLRELKKEERTDRVMETLMPLLPTVAGAALGKVAPDAGAAIELASIDALVLGINPKQLEALQATLEPAQAIAIMQAWKRADERRAKARAAALPPAAEGPSS